MEHAKCAKSCINSGLPIGFRSDDGSVYLLIGSGHDPIAKTVADVMGKKVTLEGEVKEQSGFKAIALVSVAEAK
jgi:hypothetical protein